jgi:hypothetical protein
MSTAKGFTATKSTVKIDTQVFRDPSWWQWTLTVPLLAGHLLAIPGCLAAATLLCVAMTVYFAVRLKGWRPMPVQLRIVYLGMLVAGTLPWMDWLHVVQFIGTAAMVVGGYCALARSLTLLPLNRTQPLSRDLLRRLLWEPARGGLLDFSRATERMPAASCSCSLAAPRTLQAPAVQAASPLHIG